MLYFIYPIVLLIVLTLFLIDDSYSLVPYL